MLTLMNFIPAINDQYFILITIFLGAIVAFFFINSPPAKIFLGDAGSQLLGWIMAISIIHLSSFFEFNYQKIYLFSFISIPFYDVFYIMILRFNKEKGLSGRIRSVINADQNHIHHALLKNGVSNKKTLLTLLILFFILSLLSLIPIYFNSYHLIVFVMILLFFIFFRLSLIFNTKE